MNDNGKTATRTAKSPRNGQEIPLGAHPGNTGGKKGRSGRKPFAITEAAQHAVSEYDLIQVAAKIAIHAERDSDRLAAIKLLLDRGFGAPAQVVEHTGQVDVNVKELKQTFESRVNRVVERLRTASVPGGLN